MKVQPPKWLLLEMYEWIVGTGSASRPRRHVETDLHAVRAGVRVPRYCEPNFVPDPTSREQVIEVLVPPEHRNVTFGREREFLFAHRTDNGIWYWSGVAMQEGRFHLGAWPLGRWRPWLMPQLLVYGRIIDEDGYGTFASALRFAEGWWAYEDSRVADKVVGSTSLESDE